MPDGWLFSTTGGWIVPLWVYVATFVPMAWGEMMMARTGHYVEDKSGFTGEA